jgi:NADH-quinone oxidoreductase subunit C
MSGEGGEVAGAAAEAPAEEILHGAPVRGEGQQRSVLPDRDGYPEVMSALRRDGYWVCVDLCGVDYLGFDAPRPLLAGVRPERFEVVANLLDPTARRRLRVRVQVPESDPRIASMAHLHPGVENHERETFDLFGIVFEGHPDLTRILLPDDWDGHPLRKDFSVGRIPVQFKGAPTAR